MKTIKILLIISVGLFLSKNAMAQSPLSLGVKAGLNLSEIQNMKDDIKPGFNVGLTAEMQLSNDFFLISGLEFTTKGAKGANLPMQKGEILKNTNVKLNSMYLQLPIHAAYKYQIAPGTKLVIEAGPYLAYGVGGKIKGESRTMTQEELESSTFWKIDTDFFGDGTNKFEVGLGGAVGVEFGKIGVKLGGDWAMTKVFKDKNNRNRCAYLSVGYKFF